MRWMRGAGPRNESGAQVVVGALGVSRGSERREHG